MLTNTPPQRANLRSNPRPPGWTAIATLPGHALRFHKRSVDKSGKCNAFATGDENSVIGVLFSFAPAERAALDKAEGVGSGYEPVTVTVVNSKGRRRKVLTATPDYIDDRLKPYGWYKDFVLAGGREHDLPPEYIAEYIESVEADVDTDKTRDEKQGATLLSSGR
ncbi:gamma-glutamylcyclotransferase family protein [Rhizobium ruizarguesonis]